VDETVSGHSLPQMPGAVFGEPIGRDGLTFDAIKLLNRPGANSRPAFVTFHLVKVIDDGTRRFCNVASVRDDRLDSFLPFALEHLLADAYHSVNAMFRPGHEWETNRDGRRVHKRPYAPGLLPVYRESRGVSRLNAVFVDLDCHTVGLTPGAALGSVFDMQLRGEVPPPSVLVFSGRGAWLLWGIRDRASVVPDDPDVLPASQDVTPLTLARELDLFGRLETAIGRTFSHLGADAKAKDAARIVRLAGSVNSKAGERVFWLPQFVNGRAIPFYTLDELALAFHVTVPAPIRQALTPAIVLSATTAATAPSSPSPWRWRERDPSRPVDPKRQAAARARIRSYWQHALADFETLRRLRGGRFDGCRQNAAFVFALLLRRNGVASGVVYGEVLKFAHDTGLTTDEPGAAEHAIGMAGRYAAGCPSFCWFGDQLNVTAAEAQHLTKIPPAHSRPPVPAVIRAHRTTAARRAALKLYVEKCAFVPTLDAATAYLTAAGFPVSRVTVHADYRHFDWRGRRPGRPCLPLSGGTAES